MYLSEMFLWTQSLYKMNRHKSIKQLKMEKAHELTKVTKLGNVRVGI